MIKIIKMGIGRLSVSYRHFLEEFWAEVERIWNGNRREKNCDHDGDNITCEYNERTTEEQYSNANILVTWLFRIKYVIEMKDIAHGITSSWEGRLG